MTASPMPASGPPEGSRARPSADAALETPSADTPATDTLAADTLAADTPAIHTAVAIHAVGDLAPGHWRIGVVGAGRVGAVLAAALRAAGHDIVAVAGESDASRGRVADLLPGTPIDKPSAVARSCDVLLLTVPDDMLGNVATVLTDSGAIRAGQYVVHTSGRHGLAVLEAVTRAGAHAVAVHPAMTFTGSGIDLPRLTGCVFGVTAFDRDRDFAETLVADLGGRPMWVPEEKRTLYHAGLAHGANHLVTLVTQAMEILEVAGADNPADTLRPLLTAALDNALASGDAALTGPIVRGDVNTVRAHVADLLVNAPTSLPSYVVLARDTLARAVTDGRVLPIRANRIRQVLDDSIAQLGSESLTPAERPNPRSR